MFTLLSLFDYSGVWSQPFFEAGWNVIQWDIKLADFMDINLVKDAEIALELFHDVDGIIAGPPCTDFTISGAQYWAQKDIDGRTQASVELVNQVIRLVDLFKPTDLEYDGPFFWAVENPVGRMGKLCNLGNPFYFHPYEYAGWLDLSEDELRRLDNIRKKHGIGVTEEENNLVIDCNAYKKKTGLWGEFNSRLDRRPVEPVRSCTQGSFTQRLGGKGDQTKELRSNTPLGFARAFFEANKDYRISKIKQIQMFL